MDMEAGRRAGVATVLVLTGYGRRSRETALRRRLADHVSRDVAGAARWILAERERRG
jgi:phosphoglycolate phosphatase-like HAD superfamily hydrolase